MTLGRCERREMLVDPYREKLEEWVDRSRGKVRADVAHEKLTWCRFWVVLALLDKTLASVMAAIDQTLRVVGGVPTYGLTDNEKTVTSEHVAGIPVRNAQMLDFARHYGLTIATCVPADPASKGGSENAVKTAKADLVPTEANLLPEYASFDELQEACALFCQQVNNRLHRVTRRVPAEMLAEERTRLHPLPEHPYTAAFGVTRTVPLSTPMVAFEHGSYSVPHTLAGQTVWVRPYAEQVVIVHVGDAGPIEVARHERTTPGVPRVDDAHFPPQPAGPLGRTPGAKTVAEKQFLALGEGAGLWLIEAAAGCSRIRAKMAEAVDLAALHHPAAVDRALGQAATAGRFAHGDLAAILAHQAGDPDHHSVTEPVRAGDTTVWPRAPAAGRGSVSRRRTNDGLPRYLIEDRVGPAQHRRRRRSRPAGRRGGRGTVRVGVVDRRARRLARRRRRAHPRRLRPVLRRLPHPRQDRVVRRAHPTSRCSH